MSKALGRSSSLAAFPSQADEDADPAPTPSGAETAASTEPPGTFASGPSMRRADSTPATMSKVEWPAWLPDPTEAAQKVGLNELLSKLNSQRSKGKLMKGLSPVIRASQPGTPTRAHASVSPAARAATGAVATPTATAATPAAAPIDDFSLDEGGEKEAADEERDGRSERSEASASASTLSEADAAEAEHAANVSQASELRAFTMKRLIICDNCGHHCGACHSSCSGVFCSGDCLWSYEFKRGGW